MKQWLKTLTEGIGLQNPLTVLMIGLCSTLAVSTKFEGAFFMGMAVIFVLVLSNTIVSALRKVIPEQVRIPMFIVVIASFVTIVDLTMKAFVPSVYAFLGVWIPLIVVNCMVLGRAEAFAYRNSVALSIADGIGMGLGYTMVIALMAAFREFFGSGSIQFLGATLVALPSSYPPPNILMLFPGAFILFGFVIAGVAAVNRRLAARKEAA